MNLKYVDYFLVNNKRFVKNIYYNSFDKEESEECNDNKLKRKEFYLRNGFISSNKYIIDNGVKYEILITNKKYNITKETLEKRYIRMTKSKLIKYLISKMFNVYNIKFIK